MTEYKPMKLESKDETLDFLRDYCDFNSNRAYILSCMARPKENEKITHNSIPMFRELLTNQESLEKRFRTLSLLANNFEEDESDDFTFRFYLTANPRDIDKSFYLFQKELLEMRRKSESGHEPTLEKMKRLDKKWISMLQKSGNKDDNRFIIDIDSNDLDFLNDTIDKLNDETDIIHNIETPNGFHLITEPFNYPNCDALEYEEIEIKTDGLMFLSML